MIENHIANNDFVYWHLHPDYKAEILARYKAAKSEGREYVITADEARSLVAKVGQKPVSAEMQDEKEAFSDKGLYLLIRDDE